MGRKYRLAKYNGKILTPGPSCEITDFMGNPRRVSHTVKQDAVTATGTSRRVNRRTSTRRSMEDVSIELVDEQGDVMAFDCFDLSAVGVYLHSDLLLFEGEELLLRLSLPSSRRPFSVKGKVVRADVGDGQGNAGMGVAFCDIGHDAREQLRCYVARRFVRHAQAR